jgi:branched-chain amino acid transport system ATP-binding protein
MNMKLLTINNLNSGYGDIKIIKNVSLEVNSGEIVSIIGANGAGKTTLLKTISGIITPDSGEIKLEDQRIDKLAPHQITDLGIIHVPEGRRIFPMFTVYENLLIGSTMPRTIKERKKNLEYVFELLPRLAERKRQVGSTLSGGEQQMLAIGRALMGMPRVLMLDEPSLGLSPKLVSTVFELISKISNEGITVLLVEQNVKQALKLSQRAYVLENGMISLEGSAEDIINDPQVKKAYLGL